MCGGWYEKTAIQGLMLMQTAWYFNLKPLVFCFLLKWIVYVTKVWQKQPHQYAEKKMHWYWRTQWVFKLWAPGWLCTQQAAWFQAFPMRATSKQVRELVVCSWLEPHFSRFFSLTAASEARYSSAWRYRFSFLYELHPTARRFSDDLWRPLENGTNVKGFHMILTSRFQSQCFAEFWWSSSFEKACLDMKGFHRQRNLWELF